MLESIIWDLPTELATLAPLAATIFTQVIKERAPEVIKNPKTLNLVMSAFLATIFVWVLPVSSTASLFGYIGLLFLQWLAFVIAIFIASTGIYTTLKSKETNINIGDYLDEK